METKTTEIEKIILKEFDRSRSAFATLLRRNKYKIEWWPLYMHSGLQYDMEVSNLVPVPKNIEKIEEAIYLEDWEILGGIVGMYIAPLKTRWDEFLVIYMTQIGYVTTIVDTLFKKVRLRDVSLHKEVVRILT